MLTGNSILDQSNFALRGTFGNIQRQIRVLLVGRDQMLPNILQSTGQSPTTKNYPVPNVSGVAVEKPCPKHCCSPPPTMT